MADMTAREESGVLRRKRQERHVRATVAEGLSKDVDHVVGEGPHKDESLKKKEKPDTSTALPHEAFYSACLQL